MRNSAGAYIKGEDRVGAISNTRDVHPRWMSWKGGCIAARLEAERDHWITRREYDIFGMQAFLDRYPLYAVQEL